MIVGDWLLNLPVPLMAVVIFAATYVIAACIYLAVIGLAVGDRARIQGVLAWNAATAWDHLRLACRLRRRAGLE